MKSDPQISIFRRFDYLHLRQLLYLQEELAMLESQLRQVDIADESELNNMSRRNDTNEERKALVTQIRGRLLEYGKLFIEYLTRH